jgi:hypothetical protein
MKLMYPDEEQEKSSAACMHAVEKNPHLLDTILTSIRVISESTTLCDGTLMLHINHRMVIGSGKIISKYMLYINCNAPCSMAKMYDINI